MRLKTKIRNSFHPLNKDALLIFGNQKSGSTVVAKLLSIYTGKKATIDTKLLWQPNLERLFVNPEKIKDYFYTNSYPFSKPIIKEPNLFYFRREIEEIFKGRRHVVLVRNPFQNIRSILNRLNLAGDLTDISYDIVDYRWKHIFDSHEGKNYIEKLSKRWVDFYSSPDLNQDKYIIVRYEDFLVGKSQFIIDLADDLGLPKRGEIENILDIQFQPKGNSQVDLMEFFGKENYMAIQNICGPYLSKYKY